MLGYVVWLDTYLGLNAKHGAKTEQNNRKTKRTQKNNMASFNIFPVQSTTQPSFSSPRKKEREIKRERRDKRKEGGRERESEQTEWRGIF